MFQFPGFASPTYEFSGRYRRSGGLPHSEIHGSKPARGSPWLIATCCVLHRLSVPRHPPDALQTLDLNSIFSERHAQGQTRTAAIVREDASRPNRRTALAIDPGRTGTPGASGSPCRVILGHLSS